MLKILAREGKGGLLQACVPLWIFLRGRLFQLTYFQGELYILHS